MAAVLRRARPAPIVKGGEMMDGLASLRKRRRLSTKASKVAPRKDTLSLSAPGVAGDSRNGEMPPDSAALRGKGFPLGGEGNKRRISQGRRAIKNVRDRRFSVSGEDAVGLHL